MKPIVLLGDTRATGFIERMVAEGFGVMVVDRLPKMHYEGMPWAFDNGCFGPWRNGTPWDAAAWHIRALQIRNMGLPAPLFAVVPDLPAKGQESLAFSERHLELMPHGFPKALALQDGMTYQSVKPFLKDYEWLFIGGSDAFKIHAMDWTRFARSEGKKIHYARASTLEKLEWAIHCGVDSLDSSFSVVDETAVRTVRGYFCKRASKLCPFPEVA